MYPDLRSISTSKDCSNGRPRSELEAEQLNVMGQSVRLRGGSRNVLRSLPGSLDSIWPVTVTRLRRQVMTGTGTPEYNQRQEKDEWLFRHLTRINVKRKVRLYVDKLRQKHCTRQKASTFDIHLKLPYDIINRLTDCPDRHSKKGEKKTLKDNPSKCLLFSFSQIFPSLVHCCHLFNWLLVTENLFSFERHRVPLFEPNAHTHTSMTIENKRFQYSDWLPANSWC